MRLVVDTNIVFSMFKHGSYVNRLLREYDFELYAPKELIEELSRYSAQICGKAGISVERFAEDVSLLPEVITLQNAPKSAEDAAAKLLPDRDDAAFLALASELGIPIWSNDRHFKQQTSAKVFTTEELVEFLNTA